MHGIGREVGRNIHSITPHPLGERDDIVKSCFSASGHDIRPGKPREKLGFFASVGRYYEFRSGGEVSIVFRFFWVDFADICAGDAGRCTARGSEDVGFHVEEMRGTGP